MGLLSDLEKKRELKKAVSKKAVLSPKPKFTKKTTKHSTDAEHVCLETGRLHIHRAPEEKIVEEALDRGMVRPLEGQSPHPAFDVREIRKNVEAKLKKQPRPPVMRDGRIATGIPGLDEVMEGGFKKASVNMIGGGPGSGKSIFCMQYLVEGIEKHNENGIYISFEENTEKILEDLSRFNWGLEQKINEKKLIILYYTPEQVEKVLEAGGGLVRDAIESINARRLVLDSLTAFTLLHENELQKRKAVLKLFDALYKWGCTALVVSEQEPDPTHHTSTIMEFKVDGVILLYNIRKGIIRERALEVFKMRGVHHLAKIFPTKIDEQGMRIFTGEEIF